MSHVTTCSLYQPVRAMGREDVSLQSIAHKKEITTSQKEGSNIPENAATGGSFSTLNAVVDV